MYLVVGLGNPDKGFENTRHNLGFKVADILAAATRTVYKPTCQALYKKLQIDGQEIILAKPQTFMNASGESVACLVRKFLITDPGRLIVIYDDLDMEEGKLRIRSGGSSGGHKGVESIIAETGSPEFVRVKIGIGRPPEGIDPADFVLSRIKNKSTLELFEDVCIKAADAVEAIIEEGLDQAMNKFN